jgi:hypothetical protein
MVCAGVEGGGEQKRKRNCWPNGQEEVTGRKKAGGVRGHLGLRCLGVLLESHSVFAELQADALCHLWVHLIAG